MSITAVLNGKGVKSAYGLTIKSFFYLINLLSQFLVAS
jgi:hypothetical protein